MIETIQERFELLSNREKLMVCVTVIALIYGIVDKFFLEPALKKNRQLQQQLVTTQSQVSATELEATQLEATRKKDPNSKNRSQLKTLKTQAIELKQRINQGEKKFVAPHLMTTVLRDMLNKHHRLKLVNLETVAVKPLSESEINPSVFRHGLTITFSGQYFDIHRYLQALESMPWRFYWDQIDYQVKEYPIAEVTLQVFTLSFQEEWLGV